jgi:hypothetical protein
MTNQNLIKKSKDAIHFLVSADVDLPANAIKGLNALQFQLQEEIRQTHLSISDYHEKMGDAPIKLRIPMSKFLKLMNLKTGNYEYLRDFLGAMEEIRVKWDDVDGNGFDIGFINLFSAARINNRCVEFHLTKDARILLASENNVAVIDFIKVAENLKSRYSMHLNDMIEEHMQDKTGKQIFSVDDEMLRNSLKVPYRIDKKKKVFSYRYPSELKQKLLDRVIIEYNKADMGFEVKDVKAVKNQFNASIVWTFEIVSKAILLRNQVAAELSGEVLEISHQLKSMGVSETSRSAILNSLVNEFEVAYVQYCIDSVSAAIKKKEIPNPGGYLMKAIKNNRKDFESIWEVRLRERLLAKKAEAARRQKVIEDQIDNHRNTFITKKINEEINRIVVGTVDYSLVYQKAFLDFIQTFCVSPSQRKWYKLVANGELEVEEVVKNHLFRGFLTNTMEIDEVEINEYIRSRSLTIDAS